MFVFGEEVVPILIDDIITLPLGPVGAINSDTAIIAHLYIVSGGLISCPGSNTLVYYGYPADRIICYIYVLIILS